jgi:hypothetical protein
MGLWRKIAGLFGGVGANDEQTPERSFIAQFVELARQNHLVERVEELQEGGLPVKLWLRGGGEHTVFLNNTFMETRDDAPEEKLRRLGMLLASVGEAMGQPTWEEAAPNLVPLLRVATFGASSLTAPLVSRAFAPCLRVFLGRDSASSTAIVSHDALKEWQQSEEAALDRAIDNFSKHVASGIDVQPYEADAPYPIWHVTRDDSYEASRLALPGYLAKFRGKVNGTPIAVVPHRTLVLISGDGDPRAITRLAQTAEAEFNASPRSVSAGIYTLSDDDAVVPLHLPRAHALHGVVERGHLLLLASCYAEQKTQLDARFEQEGTDLFVASLKLLEDRQTHRLTSFAAMTRGATSLLPHADRLCFVPLDDTKPFVVDFRVALTRASSCFEEAEEFDPPRVRTIAWPDDATLSELRRLAD